MLFLEKFVALSSRGPRTAFVPPFPRSDNEAQQKPETTSSAQTSSMPQSLDSVERGNSSLGDERLKQFDQKIVDLIMSEVSQLLLTDISINCS